MGIPDPAHQKEVADDVAYQQVVAAENLGAKYKTMARLLKRDWKIVGMAKVNMSVLFACIQSIIFSLRNSSVNRSKTLEDIKKYWGQAFYNWFFIIDKALGSDKFFRHLRTVVRQYKSSRMFVAL